MQNSGGDVIVAASMASDCHLEWTHATGENAPFVHCWCCQKLQLMTGDWTWPLSMICDKTLLAVWILKITFQRPEILSRCRNYKHHKCRNLSKLCGNADKSPHHHHHVLQHWTLGDVHGMVWRDQIFSLQNRQSSKRRCSWAVCPQRCSL